MVDKRIRDYPFIKETIKRRYCFSEKQRCVLYSDYIEKEKKSGEIQNYIF